MPESRNDIRVTLSAFEGEAKKWEALADLMARLRNVAAQGHLNPSAFFCGNPMSAQPLSQAYDKIYELLNTLMRDAETEFNELGAALRVARDLYEEGDRSSASGFVKIYGEYADELPKGGR